MNILLLESTDFIAANAVTITGDRLRHIQKVLAAKPGDTLSAGLVDNNMGTATITELNNDSATLLVNLTIEPPQPLPLTIILALPRPQMMRRIFRNIAEFGIKEIYLIHSRRVEKSYWQSPLLKHDNYTPYLKEGLTQAKDTVMPRIHMHNHFKPFIEDELPAIIKNKEAYVAHPYQADPMPTSSRNERVIAIGPEGGFVDYEIAQFQQQGMQAIHMGERIYRVENALTLLCQQLSG